MLVLHGWQYASDDLVTALYLKTCRHLHADVLVLQLWWLLRMKNMRAPSCWCAVVTCGRCCRYMTVALANQLFARRGVCLIAHQLCMCLLCT